MGKSKKKIDLVALIIFGVLVVSLVMTIVGICIAWTSTTGALSGNTTTSKLSDWAKLNADMVKLTEKGLKGYGVMSAFAYITVALAALTAILFVVSKFANVKALKWTLVVLSVLLIVSAIVTISTTYGFCKDYTIAKQAPAAGAWLVTVFGFLGGAAGAVGALKK